MNLRVENLIIVIIFTTLLFLALFMIIDFYVCDTHRCKGYRIARKKDLENTKEFTIALTKELFNDGIWSIPYIGSTILTFFVIWLTNIFTMKFFVIVFIFNFLVIYFLFSFFGHHYIRIYTDSIYEYINKHCESKKNPLIEKIEN